MLRSKPGACVPDGGRRAHSGCPQAVGGYPDRYGEYSLPLLRLFRIHLRRNVLPLGEVLQRASGRDPW